MHKKTNQKPNFKLTSLHAIGEQHERETMTKNIPRTHRKWKKCQQLIRETRETKHRMDNRKQPTHKEAITHNKEYEKYNSEMRRVSQEKN